MSSQNRSSPSLQKAQRSLVRRIFHTRVGCKYQHTRQLKHIMCSSELHSDGAGHSDEDDYVNSTVLEAVEVKSGSEGFLIRMQDGRYIKCVHNNPDGGRLPDYAPQPAIVLKMEDGSDLLLPIIVLELPAAMLMETVRKVHLARPTIYQVLKDVIELMGFKVKLVRVTKRVQEAYYAQLTLCKQVGDEVQEVSLDLRPSDAINIAARCQVPIQVNRQLAYGDGVRIVSDPAKMHAHASSSSRVHRSTLGMPVITELDRPQADQLSSLEAEEFVLVRSMLMAAAEERYIDAARIRDELKEFRTKGGN
ncbi:hypothetical protein GOP47_0010198 [Adiantum capillus-veneris]|uniref:BFN domain-containing protein n=1 Tax=Adiantum capillus-veneris TaxID=13818 RepID=A0A9D4UUP9_ADICA|nr:hypothetical protein GOP47_0010198 [Adiantum capillus-veneris]